MTERSLGLRRKARWRIVVVRWEESQGQFTLRILIAVDLASG
jgi:hypothetical protein